MITALTPAIASISVPLLQMMSSHRLHLSHSREQEEGNETINPIYIGAEQVLWIRSTLYRYSHELKIEVSVSRKGSTNLMPTRDK
ncbi:hypothetical protein DPEC_G00160440 [Dallia pectoralis]|uniref:Uncharacterized protein n=1 Tax=Dallia pectoralis TaxID=75939 RepID=A0ACC2GGD6_DALPE|nr:hypothetical protein DPEC_G00160440 [Dallia pectoralis]